MLNLLDVAVEPKPMPVGKVVGIVILLTIIIVVFAFICVKVVKKGKK